MRKEQFEAVTDKIIAELEKGCAPWVKQWKTSGAHAMPYNATTGKRYRGINTILLGMLPGFDLPAYLTFKQCKEAGGHVRKGEHGFPIFFFSPLLVKDKATGEEKQIPMLKQYTVFNVSQCEGLPANWYGVAIDPVAHTDAVLPEFTSFVNSTKATVAHGGDRAFYATAGDFVQMPHLSQFLSAAGYQATLAHELIHWSGAKHRLNRDFSGRFGTQAYAAEELVAELGAAFTCAHFGIDGDLRHAGYIESWIKLLKGDSRAIFTAASKAQAAFDYLEQLAVSAEAEDQPEAIAA